MNNNNVIEEQETKEEQLKRLLVSLFKNNERFKFISIEIFSENPFVFLNRTKEKNVYAEYEYDYLVISKNDKQQTRITSIPLEVIENLNINIISNKEYVVDFLIENINYHLVIELM